MGAKFFIGTEEYKCNASTMIPNIVAISYAWKFARRLEWCIVGLKCVIKVFLITPNIISRGDTVKFPPRNSFNVKNHSMMYAANCKQAACESILSCKTGGFWHMSADQYQYH